MNYSGFGGYNIASVYPNMGSGVNQNMETTPEPGDQQVLTQSQDQALPAVDPKKKTNMLVVIGIIVGAILIFGK